MGKDKHISSETIAAYLDGKATPSEIRQVVDALISDAGLRELLRVADTVDMELAQMEHGVEILPMTALAANCEDGNLCCLKCEKYILDRRNIEYDSRKMLEASIKNGWLKDDGTALHNVGRHLEYHGLTVSRRYKCCIDDIVKALAAGEDVIVAVDGGELLGDGCSEHLEDIFVGQIPDHTVVVLACDPDNNMVELYDPESSSSESKYTMSQFVDAWKDSRNYMATVNFKDMKDYVPSPIDLSDVELTEDLNELREAIAENAHEIWAESRQAEGWTYGPRRDDKLKQTPDMVPYSQLPESEKEYDRNMAMKTIKLLKKLGYDLIKRKETELYQVLKQRIKHSEQDFYCRRCGNVIYKHQVFCDRCGLELDMDWKEK